MNNPSIPEPRSSESILRTSAIFQAYDDEDDEADYDDDEEDGIPTSADQHWFARPGFASPEWFSGGRQRSAVPEMKRGES